MTDKMATPKHSNSSPAVSQLAMKIVDKIFPNPTRDLSEHNRVWREKERVEAIISAALSEREEKVARLIEAANDGALALKACALGLIGDGRKDLAMEINELADNTFAALSALGE